MNDEKPLRADAARNRGVILEAASQLFAERGVGASLDEIARHAGLGVGTVYRRFGTRDAIVEALFTDRIERVAEIARECLDDADPRRGLITFLRAGCEEMATDLGMRQAVLGISHSTEILDRTRRTLEPVVSALIARGHEAGLLRPGFHATDVPMLFLMTGTIGDVAGAHAPRLWERYFDLMLTGIMAPDAPAPGEPPLNDEQFDATMAAWLPDRRT